MPFNKTLGIFFSLFVLANSAAQGSRLISSVMGKKLPEFALSCGEKGACLDPDQKRECQTKLGNQKIYPIDKNWSPKGIWTFNEKCTIQDSQLYKEENCVLACKDDKEYPLADKFKIWCAGRLNIPFDKLCLTLTKQKKDQEKAKAIEEKVKNMRQTLSSIVMSD